MTDRRRHVGFRTKVDSSEQKVRQFPAAPVQPMGYDPGSGAPPRPVQGDALGPFVVVPPDLEEAAVYRKLSALPAATIFKDLEVGIEIDVRGARTLTLYIDYQGLVAPPPPGFPPPTITVVPQSAVVFEGSGEKRWVNYGVVNPVLYGSQLYGATPEVALSVFSTAFRDTFIAQLDWTLTDEDATQMLTFDVASIAEFRFLMGSTSRIGGTPHAGVNAALYYQLGR